MNRYRTSLIFSLAVLLCMPALAQQQLTIREASPELALETIKIDPSEVRRLQLDDLPQAVQRTWNSQVPFDTLAYWDTEDDSLFFFSLRSERIIEVFERFTPGVGNGPSGSVPPAALPAMAGQDTDFTFCIGGSNPVLGDPTDKLVFFKQKVEVGDDLLIAPPFPFVGAGIPLSDLGIGISGGRCFNIDLRGLNFFFEADEEIFGGFFLDESAGDIPNNAQVQFVVDDGNGTIVGPDASQPGYYNPPRTVYFDDSGPGGYFFFRGRKNLLFEENVEYNAAPTIDIEINTPCGFVDTCRFNPGQTLTYTGCLKNNSGTRKTVDITVQAFLPNGSTQTLLLLTPPPVPPGPRFCRTLSQEIPGNAPSGFYAVQVLVDDPDGVDFTYDTDRFFLTISESSSVTTGGPQLSRADLMSAEPEVSPEWTVTPLGEWEIVEDGAAATLGEPVAIIGTFPNPFARETTIRFEATAATEARLVIYDVMGREVAVLVDGAVEAGTHDVVFDARGLASGLYVYRLEAGAQTQTGRITLLK